jgi:predicted choloylglycine hydrolase
MGLFKKKKKMTIENSKEWMFMLDQTIADQGAIQTRMKKQIAKIREEMKEIDAQGMVETDAQVVEDLAHEYTRLQKKLTSLRREERTAGYAKDQYEQLLTRLEQASNASQQDKMFQEMFGDKASFKRELMKAKMLVEKFETQLTDVEDVFQNTEPEENERIMGVTKSDTSVQARWAAQKAVKDDVDIGVSAATETAKKLDSK